MRIELICFGPLAEHLGWKSQEMNVDEGTTPRKIAELLGVSDWLNAGLTFAIDGQMCAPDNILSEGVELAMLPPVSGG
jgi:molybdopterin converting factor small subunit